MTVNKGHLILLAVFFGGVILADRVRTLPAVGKYIPVI